MSLKNRIKFNYLIYEVINISKFDFNKVIITGIPVNISPLNHDSHGVSVFNMRLKLTGIKRETFITVTVWGELAEKVFTQLSPSEKILVEGSLGTSPQKDGDSSFSSSLEITAARIFF